MNESQQEAVDGPAPPERKTEWTRPEVDRFMAGAAEGSADVSVDGLDNPS